MGRLKLYVIFEPTSFARMAPLFVDVFPYRRGDHYVSRNMRRLRVRLSLMGPITREQIHCIEMGRYAGYIVYYMVLPAQYRLGKRP